MREKIALVAHRKGNSRYDIYETAEPTLKFDVADRLRQHPPLGAPDDGGPVVDPDPIETDVTLDEMTEPGGPIGYAEYNQLMIVDEDGVVDSYQVKATSQKRIEDNSVNYDVKVWDGYARLIPDYSDREVESVTEEYLGRG